MIPQPASVGIRRTLAVLAAGTALTLSGCAAGTPTAAPGTSTSAAATGSTTSAAPSPQALAWTESVCGALVPVAESLVNPPDLDVGSPAGTRQAYLGYLTRAQDATDRALQDLDQAGPAPVDGGQQVTEAVRGDLAELRDDLVDARTQLEQADTNDPVAVGRAVVAAANVVGAVANSAQTLSTLDTSPQLRAAFDQAQSCQRLRAVQTPARLNATTAPTAPATPR